MVTCLDLGRFLLLDPGADNAETALPSPPTSATPCFSPAAPWRCSTVSTRAHEPGDLLDGPSDLGLDEEEAGYALEETMSLLRDTIARLSDDVPLVHIG